MTDYISKYEPVLVGGMSSRAPLSLKSRGGPAVEWPSSAPTVGDVLTYAAVGTLAYYKVGERVIQGLVPTDSSAPVAAANADIMQEYAALGVPLVAPAGTYYLSDSFELTNSLRGAGFAAGGTQFRASVALPHLCLVSQSNVTLSDLHLHGGGVADVCVSVLNGGLSMLRKAQASNAKYDGVSLAGTGNNNGVRLDQCLFKDNGSTYTTGTVSGTAGGNTLSFSGAADLTTLGIRLAQDGVHIPTETAYMNGLRLGGIYHEITAISATTLEVYPALAVNLSSVPFVICRGNGFVSNTSGDTGVAVFTACTFQNNAGAGILEHSLYGAREYANIYEYNAVGRVVGRINAPSAYTIRASSKDAYNEGNAVADFVAAYASAPTYEPGPSDKPADIAISANFGSDSPLLIAPAKVFYTPAASTSVLMPEYFSRVARITTNHQVTVQSHSFRSYLPGAEYEYHVQSGILTIVPFTGVSIANLGTGKFAPGTNLVVRCTANNAWEVIVTRQARNVPTTVTGTGTYLLTAADAVTGCVRISGYNRVSLPTALEEAAFGLGDEVTLLVDDMEFRQANVESAETSFLSKGPGSVIRATRLAGNAWRVEGDLLPDPILNVNGLVQYLTADLGGVDLSGGTVGGMYDRSGNSNDVVWTGAPFNYVEGGMGGPNAVVGDAGRSLALAAFTGGALTGDVTHYVVATTPSAGSLFFFDSSDVSGRRQAVITTAAVKIALYNGTFDEVAVPSAMAGGTRVLVRAFFPAAGYDADLRVEPAAAAVQTAHGNMSPAHCNGSFIASAYPGGNNSDGYTACKITINGRVSDEVDVAIRSFLRRKYHFTQAVVEDPPNQQAITAGSSSGRYRLRPAPDLALPVTGLVDTGSVTLDFDPKEDGYFNFAVSALLKRATSLNYREIGGTISGYRTGGAMTIYGVMEPIYGGDATGLTITMTAFAGGLRIQLDNDTGETVNGRVLCGWSVQDPL